MPKIDLAAVPETSSTGYPKPYSDDVARRHYRRLATATGLSDFGVNLCRLEPGAWSSQRHWHSHEDEFVMMVSGEAVLVTEGRETALHPGDCAAFRAGDTDAHHIVNRSAADCIFLVIGTDKAEDVCSYPDIDLHLKDGRFQRKDGSFY
jgi:uncharacterized cupin superfamily protein